MSNKSDAIGLKGEEKKKKRTLERSGALGRVET